jgi:hypothetical protein
VVEILILLGDGSENRCTNRWTLDHEPSENLRGERKDSSRYQLKRRVPEGVLERVRGRQIFWFPHPDTDPLTVQTTIGKVASFSLRTANPKVAERQERTAREQLRQCGQHDRMVGEHRVK